jgi:hypothetical protein
MKYLLPVVMWSVAAGVVGCGAGGETPTPINLTNADGSFLTCATDTRALPYTAGMQVTSDQGTFIVKLLASTPAPPVKGQNSWSVEVDEADTGAPQGGLSVTVSPWMPDHQHGTTPAEVTAPDSGPYTLSPIYTYMSGLWQIRFTIVGTAVGAGTTDTAIIPICIP